MLLYAYDLDGTLADTYEAVRRSYIEAGAALPERKNDWWGKPWRQWLDDEKIHNLKNEIYRSHLAHELVKPLPMFDLYQITGGMIITGASNAGAAATLKAIGVDPSTLRLFTNLAVSGKAGVLNKLWDEKSIYFDDDPDACDILHHLTDWRVVCVTQNPS